MALAHREGRPAGVANNALMEASIAQACLKAGHPGKSDAYKGVTRGRDIARVTQPRMAGGTHGGDSFRSRRLGAADRPDGLLWTNVGCYLPALIGKLAMRSSPRRITAGRTSTVIVSTTRS